MDKAPNANQMLTILLSDIEDNEVLGKGNNGSRITVE
jgi:hypothetical protein